ncbi:disease resistance protein Pik-2-like isoform X3 [Miscanthus floridulus]|uniref:disease resistance protein Pik-2-like isoform X3 n=1 Tax=Miscanthus floridulus TaxID=154761 RepID=UPI003458991C
MADMALGLTKKAVEGTVSRVLAAIDEDTKLKSAVKQDLRFIVGEFQMMESFLEMANDNKERTSNKVVKTWVRQLRELAFDVEDCVEFVIHLDTTSARVWWSWVWGIVPLPSCMTPAWVEDLHQAFAQLKQLNARVDEVSQRNTRYKLLSGDDSVSSTTPSPVPPEQLEADAFHSTVEILRDLWEANAKQSSSLKCNLKYLVDDGRCNELRVISVWRAAGVDVETAHILNAAYLDPEICKQFKARARVKLMHPFNIQQFLKTLLNQLYVTSQQQDTLSSAPRDLLRTNGDSVIQDKLRQLLSKHKYLVILEDLSSAVDWDLIRLCLPDLGNGSRIVISTQQVGIALSCTGEPYRVLQLALLPNNDRYIYAFYKPSGIGITELVRQLGQRRVISLWGDEGGDTASLVRDVYGAIRKKTAKFKGVINFKNCWWVNVPSPFSLEGFYRRLPGYVRHGYENPESYFAEHWSEEVCNSCSLIFIDGLQSKEDWDLIKDKLVPENTMSCIVIIANEEAVAKYIADEDNSSRKKDYEEQEEANNAAIIGPLFAQKVAEKQKNESITEKNLKHAERIVPKCGGLPKIIDAVARSPCSFWENINNDLVTKLKNDPKLRGVLSWMHSYIDGRSDSVKPCIFYLSVFPTNYKIRKAHLLRRWIAEGYCRDTTGSSAKESAERLFDELFSRDIIQTLPSMPVCQINGFFREYIISQPMEDNLVFVLEGHRKPNSQRTVQHLTIMEDWEREKHVFESIDVSRLRSLTVYGKWKPFFISDKMKRIRVLDLEGTSGVEDCCLKHIFEILLSLKFICLRGCKSITCLPKTMGGLRQLESLDVSGTSIVTLPRAIIKLQKIQYIRAGCKFLPDEDCTSAASEVGGQKKLVGCCWTSTKSSQGSDDAVGSQQPSGTTATPEAEGSDGGHQGQHQHHKQRYQKIKKVGRRWTSRLSSCSWFAHNNINGGVEVPVGIEDMPSLHTLGTVNISKGGGKDFLTMLKLKTTLPQLFKLSVCGINKENWKDLCDALSAHDHLESLSLGLDNDFTEDIYFGNLPKALKNFKVYGHIHRLPAWIKDGRLEANLKKFDIEAIISRQECMDQLVESLPHTKNGGTNRRLCIKPTRQVRELEFRNVMNDDISRPQVLKIDCSFALEVAFQTNSIATEVNVLIIHCYKGTDFPISVRGLKYLDDLETVWLKGYDEKAGYVVQLKKQIAAHPRKPVFKFEKLNSA